MSKMLKTVQTIENYPRQNDTQRKQRYLLHELQGTKDTIEKIQKSVGQNKEKMKLK